MCVWDPEVELVGGCKLKCCFLPDFFMVQKTRVEWMDWVSLFQSSAVSSASESFCCLCPGGLLSLDPLNIETLSNSGFWSFFWLKEPCWCLASCGNQPASFGILGWVPRHEGAVPLPACAHHLWLWEYTKAWESTKDFLGEHSISWRMDGSKLKMPWRFSTWSGHKPKIFFSPFLFLPDFVFPSALLRQIWLHILLSAGIVLVLVQCPWENITLHHNFVRRNDPFCVGREFHLGEAKKICFPHFQVELVCRGRSVAFRVFSSFSSCLAFPNQKFWDWSNLFRTKQVHVLECRSWVAVVWC